MVNLRGNTVTSSSFTARIESIPSSYGPSMPELPPRREIPTERMRSRSIVTGWVLIVPALVITKPSNGICFHHLAQSTGEGGQTEIERGGRTHKDIFPPAIVTRKVQPVLPQIVVRWALRLYVDKVRAARARVSCGSHAQREEAVVRYVVRELAE